MAYIPGSRNMDPATRAERMAKREASVKQQRGFAEEFKEEGNAFFRQGEWKAAISSYESAIKVYGPRSTYLNNLAAVYLKLDRFEAAEEAADAALHRSPKLLKARYRRGLARRSQGTNKKLRLAIQDFENCLKLDSNCIEAKTEMEQTQALLAERTALKTRLRQHRSSSNDPDSDDYDDLSDSDESSVDYDDPVTRVIVMRDGPGPAINESDHDTPFESCTSDYEHEGEYGVPCRYYNSRGCIKGSTCPYRHAPDSKSVRDKLGRNVCLFHLLEVPCRFGEKCVYTHDRTFLPPGWWNFKNEAIRDFRVMMAELRDEPYEQNFIDKDVVMAGVIFHMERKFQARGYGHEVVSPPPAAPLKPTKARKPNGLRGVRNRGRGGPKTGRGRGRGMGHSFRSDAAGLARILGRDIDWDGDSEDEMEQRMNNGGFLDDEVMELMSQGVKPWDDDAWDVLHALNDF